MLDKLMCFLFGHVYGKWEARDYGRYERRDCTRCGCHELKGRGSYE